VSTRSDTIVEVERLMIEITSPNRKCYHAPINLQSTLQARMLHTDFLLRKINNENLNSTYFSQECTVIDLLHDGINDLFGMVYKLKTRITINEQHKYS
jgi:hypothetical protein